MSCSHETLVININTSTHPEGGEERKRELCSARIFSKYVLLIDFDNELHNHSTT